MLPFGKLMPSSLSVLQQQLDKAYCLEHRCEVCKVALEFLGRLVTRCQ